MLFINSVLIYLTIIIISYFFWRCCQNVFFIRRLNTLPGPKTLPFIGTYYLLHTQEELLDIVFNVTKKYTSPCQIWLGSKLFIAVYKPEDIKTVLYSKNCIDKSMMYNFAPPLLGMGIFTAPASMWTRFRTMTAPTFSSHMLRNFFDVFVEQSVIFAHELEKNNLNGNEIIFLEHISKFAWRIACDSMMGIILEPNKNNQYVKAILRLKGIFMSRIRNILLFPEIIFNLSTLGRKQKKDVNLIRSFTDEMIQQRIHEYNLNTTKDKTNQTRTTYFDIIMEASSKKNFTRDEIHDNVTTMVLTASDSITVTMNFVVFMLANFPEIQKKVHEELLEIYGTETIKSVPVKYDDLQHMPYLDRVIKETMRLFPPLPLIGREVTNDFKIGEVTVSKGTNIVIGIIKMHRDEKYWPNPLMFDPDRFLPEKAKNYQSCYIPFSDGPRNCIGLKYAMMSMKVILAMLVRTFVFKVNKSVEIEEIKLKFDTLLTTDKPLEVKIEKRYFQ